MKSLVKDITESSIADSRDESLDCLVDQYNSTLSSIIDVHAPTKLRWITFRPHAQWYNDELRVEKRDKRRRERRFKCSNLEIDRQLFKQQCDKYYSMIEKAKTDYHKQHLSSCDGRALFAEVNRLANGPPIRVYPSLPSGNELAISFRNFFIDKVHQLITSIPTTTKPTVLPPSICQSSFSDFSPVDMETVSDMIAKSSSKSCVLDPIPTGVLKSCKMALVGTITTIVNFSLSSGHVPPSLKTACVTPRLKKKSLNPEELQNYRPISTLPFLSKLLERVVAFELNNYLLVNNLMSPLQSAYRRHHSCETALLRVTNDLLMALDSGREVLLVLLDFSAAFDTINHTTLLGRLKDRFGISGTALNWLESYLTNRRMYVNINGCDSPTSPLHHGVPQGSVLGPLLFTLYVSPLEDIVELHGLDAMFYADDSQIYVILNSKQRSETIESLELCAADVKSWAEENYLVLSDRKTEILHIYSNFSRNKTPVTEVKIGSSTIIPNNQVKDLGVFLDNHLNLNTHIGYICKKASFALRNLGKIRKYLDGPTTERLVHAFVSSQLDSCNGILFGLPAYQIQRLQRIQNSAARLVTLTRSKEHITPVLKNLHWLRIQERIKFKILLITYKILNNMAPSYLRELVQPYKSQRSLRSQSKALLKVPPTRTSTFGDRAFCVSAPKLWNSIPQDIKMSSSVELFKKKLKTFLFSSSYND